MYRDSAVNIINEKYGFVSPAAFHMYDLSKKDFKDVRGITNYCILMGYKYVSALDYDRMFEIIDTMKECESKIGYVNTKVMRKHFGVPEGKYHTFGGIRKICDMYGINYFFDGRYNPEDILNAAKEFYDRHGYIRQVDFTSETGYSACAIKSAYGTFNKLLEAAGIPVYMKHHYEPEVVLEDVKRVIKEYDSISCTTYRKYGRYAQSVITGAFGTWQDLMRSLGFDPVRKRYGKKFMRDTLINIYEECGTLSSPIINAMAPFTYEAAAFVFGGRAGVAEAVGDLHAFDRNKSSGHLATSKILKELYGLDGFIEEYTFDWLINPETNKHMYMDFYIPFANKCIEFQGEQHYRYTEYMFKTMENFEKAQRRDRYKKELSDKYGVKIEYIKYDDALTKEFVKEIVER